jgi:hypothetical protein
MHRRIKPKRIISYTSGKYQKPPTSGSEAALAAADTYAVGGR